MPIKLVQEIISHYNDIFSEATLKLHAENEKRRLARPIVAQQQLQSEEKSSKRGNSLMSFMRPTINTAEELNKWTVNSMMGVFQRTSNSTTSPTTSPTISNNNRSVPLSFGSTITHQESPPASPSISSAIPVSVEEEPKVMFDGGDDIFDSKKQPKEEVEAQHAKTEEILNDIDTKPTTAKDDQDNTQQQQKESAHDNIDSSFFDDDDDEDDE